MSAVISAEVKLDACEPKAAVSELFALLERGCANLNEAKIGLHLICMANPGVLERLARDLPADALGFKILTEQRTVTSEEFLRKGPQRMSSFSGDLTNWLSSERAIEIVRELVNSPPAMVRSASFGVSVSNLRWRGATDGVGGRLHMSDMKVFRSAARFSCTAAVDFPDTVSDAEISKITAAIAQATGVGFKAKDMIRIPTVGDNPEETGKSILIGQICFDAAIADIRRSLGANIVENLRTVGLTDDEAFDERMENLGEGKAVSFAPISKKAVKELLPEFTFHAADVDGVTFKKPLGPDTEMFIAFYKSQPRVGKAFTLEFGVRSPKSGIEYKSNLFRLAGTTEDRSWVYSEKEEAVAAVRDAIGVLKLALPTIETSVKTFFSTWPVAFPQGIKRLGNLTAQAAYKLAVEHAPGASLVRIHSRMRSLRARDFLGPDLSADGRLTDNGAWWLHFYLAPADYSFEVTVPAIGDIEVLDHGAQYQDGNSQRYLVPLTGYWIDSDAACRIADLHGASEQRAQGKFWGLIAQLTTIGSATPFWRLEYLISDERGRNDFRIDLDASSGEKRTDL